MRFPLALKWAKQISNFRIDASERKGQQHSIPSGISILWNSDFSGQGAVLKNDIWISYICPLRFYNGNFPFFRKLSEWHTANFLIWGLASPPKRFLKFLFSCWILILIWQTKLKKYPNVVTLEAVLPLSRICLLLFSPRTISLCPTQWNVCTPAFGFHPSLIRGNPCHRSHRLL